MPDRDGPQLIGSLTRGLVILEILLERGEAGVSELARELGVNRSSAYRLLRTLEERGFVWQDREGGLYRLGMKLARFRMHVLDHMELAQAARPYLKKLSDLTGEASALSVLHQDEGLLIGKYVGPQRIIANLTVGMAEPLYCTALGKALFAFLPPEQQRRLLGLRKLEARTSKTLTTPASVLRDMADTVRLGAAVDNEEYSEGMRCVAAPVYDHTGAVAASIGISGPVSRVTPERLDELIAVTRSVAGEFSRELGAE